MNANWIEEIEEREFHGKPEGKWIIQGWYEDEKEDFLREQIIWEEKQSLSWDILSEYPDFLARSIFDMADDHFSWNVTTPTWFLHQDGTWNKSLSNHTSVITKLMYGEYESLEGAQKMIMALDSRFLQRPRHPMKFKNYLEHLKNADEPTCYLELLRRRRRTIYDVFEISSEINHN